MRRERNRQAQHVFRARKQAEQQEKDQQIQKLADEVEQMGSVFFNLADAITGSAYARLDSKLVQTLRDSMTQIVRLASEDADQAFVANAPGPGPAQGPVQPVPLGLHGPATATQQTAATAALYTQTHPLSHADHGRSIPEMPVERAVFSLPPALSQMASSSVLSTRIIQEMLRFGYMVVSNRLDLSNSALESTVRFTLRYQSREETITNIEWALRAGTW